MPSPEPEGLGRTESIHISAFLSGMSALIYQSAWIRQLALLIGASTPSVAVGLAVYMAGLATGGAVAARLAGSPGGWLRRYVGIELALALLAPALTLLMGQVSSAAVATTPWLAGCLALMFFITVLEGATTPILVGCIARHDREYLREIPAMYGTNTIGAATGAFLPGLVLMEAVGITGSVLVGAMGSLTAALVIMRSEPEDLELPAGDSAPTPNPRAPPSPECSEVTAEALRIPSDMTSAGGLMAVTAFSSLGGMALEVLCTRAFVCLFSAHAYGLAMVLGSLLLGLAVGGYLVRALPGLHRDPGHAIAWVMFLLGVCCLLTLPVLTRIGAGYDEVHSRVVESFSRYLAVNGLVAFCLVFPPGILLGMVPPLVAVSLARSGLGSTRAVGRVGLMSGLGSMAGPPLAAFILLPMAGLDGAFRLLAGVLALTGLTLVRRSAMSSRVVMLVIFGCGLTVTSAFRSSRLSPDRTVVTSVDSSFGSATVARDAHGIQWMTTNIGGAVGDDSPMGVRMQRRQYLVPALLATRRERVMSLGLGTGITMSGIVDDPVVEQLVAVEISPAVLVGARAFAEANRGILDDPRTKIVLGDGRAWLRREGPAQDVILIELFNGEEVGLTALYSREFYRICSKRLGEGGVVAQCLSMLELPPEVLLRVISTFASEFEHGGIWMIFPDILLLIGSRTPLTDPTDRFSRARKSPLGPIMDQANLRRLPDLMGLCLGPLPDPDRRQPWPVVEDDRPEIEFEATRSLLFVDGRRFDQSSYHALSEVLDLQRIPVPVEPSRSIQDRLRVRTALLEALSLRASADHAAALEIMDRVLDEVPDHVDAVDWREQIRDQFREQGHRFREAARDDPSPSTHLALGQWLTASGAHEEASRVLLEAREADPERLETALALALLRIRQGDVDRAREILESATRSHPTSIQAWNNLGRLLLEAGDVPGARQALERAFALDPGNPVVAANLRRLVAEPGPSP